MSRSYTKGYMKNSGSNRSWKKISNKKFRQNSKKDPEGVTKHKKQGENSYEFISKGFYAVNCEWATYRWFCK